MPIKNPAYKSNLFGAMGFGIREKRRFKAKYLQLPAARKRLMLFANSPQKGYIQQKTARMGCFFVVYTYYTK